MSKRESITIRVSGRIGEKEISPELLSTKKKYDEEYLESLIDKATPRWEGVDADEWLRELRGDYE